MFRERLKDGTTRLTGGVVTRALDVYPVGAIYMSVDSTSPATLFGGTWTRFAQGRVVLGVDEGDSDFDVPMETGGAKTHTLTTGELPSHGHSMTHDHTATTTSAGGHTHSFARKAAAGTSSGVVQGNVTAGLSDQTTSNDGAHTHPVNIPTLFQNTGVFGGSGAHNNMQPFISAYIWRRTA